MAAKTVFVYPLTGGRDFPISFEYLARKFVQVSLKGAGGIKRLVLNTDFRFSTKTQITTTQSWAADGQYDVIEIRRYTSATERLVDFNDGSILRAYDLNLSQIQTLHVAEEARDLTTDTIGVDGDGNLDARNRRIVNLADGIDPQDAVTVKQVRDAEGSIGSSVAAAAESARQAKASEVAAAGHVTAAAGHASAAANSATTAIASADTATAASFEAKASATAAAGSAVQADTSAELAVQAAGEADQHKRQAALSAGEAKLEADRAKREADRAEAAADGAAQPQLAVNAPSPIFEAPLKCDAKLIRGRNIITTPSRDKILYGGDVYEIETPETLKVLGSSGASGTIQRNTGSSSSSYPYAFSGGAPETTLPFYFHGIEFAGASTIYSKRAYDIEFDGGSYSTAEYVQYLKMRGLRAGYEYTLRSSHDADSANWPNIKTVSFFIAADSAATGWRVWFNGDGWISINTGIEDPRYKVIDFGMGLLRVVFSNTTYTSTLKIGIDAGTPDVYIGGHQFEDCPVVTPLVYTGSSSSYARSAGSSIELETPYPCLRWHDMTVGVSFKGEAIPNRISRLICIRSTKGTTDSYPYVIFGINNIGNLGVMTRSNDGTEQATDFGIKYEPYNPMMLFRISGGSISACHNGAVASVVHTFSMERHAVRRITLGDIGARELTPNGEMCDFRVWGQALTDLQMKGVR